LKIDEKEESVYNSCKVSIYIIISGKFIVGLFQPILLICYIAKNMFFHYLAVVHPQLTYSTSCVGESREYP